MKNYFITISLGIFGWTSYSHAGLLEDYSIPYTRQTLMYGVKINETDKNLPKSVYKELEERADWDDVNFNAQIIFDQKVYKVISLGAEELGNGNSFVLGVFDTKGNYIGRCVSVFNKICELSPENQ